jgi:hypothetical protein
MVLDQAVFFQKGVQALMETLRGEDFHKKIDHLRGYDFRSSGKILFSKP